MDSSSLFDDKQVVLIAVVGLLGILVWCIKKYKELNADGKITSDQDIDITFQPSLFGLENTNYDLSKEKSWGKNIFTNTFPTSLSLYLHSKNMDVNYITSLDGKSVIIPLSVQDLFGLNFSDYSEIEFQFEGRYEGYGKYMGNQLEKIDLVVARANSPDQAPSVHIRPLEIKLTAVPDSTTADSDESKWSPEIVVRTPTIPYLACSLAESCSKSKSWIFDQLVDINWDSKEELVSDETEIAKLRKFLEQLVGNHEENQTPFVLHAIWRTEGQSHNYSEDCLDVFSWSNLSLANLILSRSTSGRGKSALIWLCRILFEISFDDRFDWKKIKSKFPTTGQGSKALAVSGKSTLPFMNCEQLQKPRIKKNEISEIILGGGQNFIKPERRFDVVLMNNSKDIFDS